MLREELESAQWVQKTLSSRIDRLSTEVSEAEADLSRFKRENARVAGGTGAGSMSRSLERELQTDVRRRRERLNDARRLKEQARSREGRIAKRLDEVINGPAPSSGGSTYRSKGKPRALKSVDDELEAMKKRLGK